MPMHIFERLKIGYPLMILCSKCCLFIQTFSKSSCILFFTFTVLESSVYSNSQNIIRLYTFLVQITTFGFEYVLYLRFLKLPRTNLEIESMILVFCYCAFSGFF